MAFPLPHRANLTLEEHYALAQFLMGVANINGTHREGAQKVLDEYFMRVEARLIMQEGLKR